eukprot:GHUV01051348.1.p1 GENE.GHUV01051348.1~~GHUV01051348.1.p1  ORF type:complete len:242 (+),score=47.48 GHUV01051348.1:74-799(+)
MGYAMPEQTAHGIHIRLYARAFIFAEAGNPTKRFLLVNIDAAMPSQLLTRKLVQKLQAEFNGLYRSDNVAISATHTHASPAGYLEHLLYHVTSLGFVKQSFDAMLDGILEASHAAHADLRPAALSWSEGELLGANINRSPTAYMANPEAERAQYKHDTDKDMTLLKIRAAEGGQRWVPSECDRCILALCFGNSMPCLCQCLLGVTDWVTERMLASAQTPEAPVSSLAPRQLSGCLPTQPPQ